MPSSEKNTRESRLSRGNETHVYTCWVNMSNHCRLDPKIDFIFRKWEHLQCFWIVFVPPNEFQLDNPYFDSLRTVVSYSNQYNCELRLRRQDTRVNDTLSEPARRPVINVAFYVT